jgi:hypothetical protein
MTACALFQRIAIATVMASTSCGPSLHEETPRHTDALIVCPGSDAVHWVRFEGTDQLSYQVQVEYPADTVISCISQKLSQNGWQALEADFWNPGLPSSKVRRWAQFTDASVHPEATVDVWSNQWQNQAGDIAWYYLTYRYPPKDRHILFVNAGFIPADIAKKQPKTPQTRK